MMQLTTPFFGRQMIAVLCCLALNSAGFAANNTAEQSSMASGDLRTLSLAVPVEANNRTTIVAYLLKSFSTPQILQKGTFLVFDENYPADSVSFRGAVDLESSPRIHLMLRNEGLFHPTNDRENVAKGKWNTRRIDLSSCAGKPFQNVFISSEFRAQKVGSYRVSYRNIRIEDAAGRICRSLMPSAGELTDPQEDGLPEGSQVTMSEQAIVSAMPAKFLFKTGENVPAILMVKAVDPVTPINADIQLSLIPLDGEKKTLLTRHLDLKPGETKNLRIDAGNLSAGNYRFEVQTVIGKRNGVSASPVFTVTGSQKSLPAAADILAQRQMLWGSDVQSSVGIRDLAILRQSGGNYVNIFISWAELEPRQGEYHFEKLDRVVRNLERANLRGSIFMGNYNPGDFPAWTRNEQMLCQDGNIFKGNLDVTLSFWAPTARSAYMKFIQALLARYKNCPTIIGYQLSFGGWGDSFYYTPAGKLNAIHDYSEFSQAKFREYVRDVLGLDLKTAAKRYGLELKSWNDLRQPLPVTGLDLRPIWWDFQNYRVWSVEKMWDDVCATATAADPDRMLLLCYGGSQDRIGLNGNDYDAGCRIARKYKNAVFHNTCYESPGPAPLLGSYSRRWGLKHDSELAGTPASYSQHQMGMFNVLKFGSIGYSWVTGKNLDGIYSSYSLLRPPAEQLVTAAPVGKRLGLLQSTSLFQCNLLAMQKYRPMLDGALLATRLSLPPDMLTDRAFLEETPDLDPAVTPVFIDYGNPVLTAEAADAMAAYVRKGGTLILFPCSGRNTAGNEKETFRLFRLLGFDSADRLPAPAGNRQAKGDGLLLNCSGIVPLTILPPDSNVLAQWDKGDAALASWRCGKGQVLLLGGAPNVNDAQTMASLAGLLAKYGLAAPIKTGDNVESFLRTEGNSLYAVVHNRNGRFITSQLAIPAIKGSRRVTNLIDATSLGIKSEAQLSTGINISLAPNEVTVFALDLPDAPPRTFPAADYPVSADNGVVDGNSIGAAEIAHATTRPAAMDKSGFRPAIIITSNIDFTVPVNNDGVHILTLNTDKETDNTLKVFIDGQMLEPVADSPGSFRCPDIRRGQHNIKIDALNRTLLYGIRLVPVLKPLDQWLIAGPFDNPDGFKGNSFYQLRVPENNWSISSEYMEKGKKIAWVKKYAPEGQLKLSEIMAGIPKSLAYAQCTLEAPRDCVLRLDCGVDYAFLLWVNGTMIFDSNTVTHGSGPGEFAVDVPLKKGRNLLAVKVAPGSSDWNLYLKIGDIPGLTIIDSK